MFFGRSPVRHVRHLQRVDAWPPGGGQLNATLHHGASLRSTSSHLKKIKTVRKSAIAVSGRSLLSFGLSPRKKPIVCVCHCDFGSLRAARPLGIAAMGPHHRPAMRCWWTCLSPRSKPRWPAALGHERASAKRARSTTRRSSREGIQFSVNEAKKQTAPTFKTSLAANALLYWPISLPPRGPSPRGGTAPH